MTTPKENLSDFGEALKILGKKLDVFSLMGLMNPLAKEMQQRAIEDEQERVKKQIRKDLEDASDQIIQDTPRFSAGETVSTYSERNKLKLLDDYDLNPVLIKCKVSNCRNVRSDFCDVVYNNLQVDEMGKCAKYVQAKIESESLTVSEVDKIVEEVKEELREPVRRKRREL